MKFLGLELPLCDFESRAVHDLLCCALGEDGYRCSEEFEEFYDLVDSLVFVELFELFGEVLDHWEVVGLEILWLEYVRNFLNELDVLDEAIRKRKFWV